MNQLKELYTDYENYRLNSGFAGNPEALYDSMQYIMDLGGKRARPLLVLTSCLAAGGAIEKAMPVAHAIEIFHNFSLVHDDIMDRAEVRRGQPTVHVKWAPATAILAGDNMLVAAYHTLLELDHPKRNEILRLFTTTAREVCEGQQMDMDFAGSDSVAVADYLNMIRLKTAVLLGCSAACGGLCANADSEKTNLYYRFAVALGMSFQLRDDYLDTFGDPQKTGKKLGGDIAERKKTWLYVAAAEKTTDIYRVYAIEEESERISLATELFRSLELDKGLLELAMQYETEAWDHLAVLSNLGEETGMLKRLFQYLSEREN